MIFEEGNISLNIIQEPAYTLGSTDNLRSYSIEYNLEPEYQASTIYGLDCGSQCTCVLLAGGGASALTSRSAIIQDSKVWIGIGDQLVCLSLPNFKMLWHVKIDEATCFGIYLSPDGEGLLVHGELSISKCTFSGGILWSTSGKDIFSEGFSIYQEHIETIDFNNEIYRIEIKNGDSKLV